MVAGPAALGAGQHGRDHLAGHLAECLLALRGVPADAEVHLRQRAESPPSASRSMSSPISTPYAETNGTRSSAERRPAYSPPSGWTNPASSGHSALSSGRAVSSVTRPPPAG